MIARLEDVPAACFQGVVPSTIVTCSRGGEPNTTYLSQVYAVDGRRVALSCQFFNKTKRNIEENPHAVACVTSPDTFEAWNLELEFVRSETSGPIFDVMEMQIEAIASLVGMKGIFKLKAADIFRVTAITKAVGERIPLAEIPRLR